MNCYMQDQNVMSKDIPITLEHEEATSTATVAQDGAGTAQEAACTAETAAPSKRRVCENHISNKERQLTIEAG